MKDYAFYEVLLAVSDCYINYYTELVTTDLAKALDACRKLKKEHYTYDMEGECLVVLYGVTFDDAGIARGDIISPQALPDHYYYPMRIKQIPSYDETHYGI